MQDTIGKGLNKFQDSIDKNKKKLDTMKEISKFNDMTKKISDQKTNLLIELGNATYYKFRNGKIEDFELIKICERFIELDTIIYTNKKKVNELSKSEDLKCSCGMKLEVDNTFCGNCGSKVEILKESDDINCSICECKIPNNSKFCPCCGSKRY